MFGLNQYAIIGMAAFYLLSIGGASFLSYERGHDDMRNAQTEQKLADTSAELTRTKARQKDGTTAAKEHDSHEDEIRRLYGLLRSGPGAVHISPDSDPLVPVWAVRMHDRAASGWISGDPYPGKSDSDASDVRLSQVLAMCTANYERHEINRSRLTDIIRLEPVLPALPPATEEAKPSFLSNLNPFN